MNTSVTVVLGIVAAAVVGCSGQTAPPERPSGKISLDGTAHTATSVKCGQDEWRLRIETVAGPTESRAYLVLDGDTPAVDAVTINSPDGFNGTAGSGVGSAEATVTEGTYTITGTAEGFDRAAPGERRATTFRIEAPC